ncbi:MAG: carboxymuconolactone decarboxylase family protein [Bacteriovoracia bacterium]
MEQIKSLLADRDTTIARDLNLNFERLLAGEKLEPKEAALAVLATARSVGYDELAKAARERLRAMEVAPEEIREGEESAAIMGMLNTYYKFRSFIFKVGEEKQTDYAQAGLRMTSLARPVLGKVQFEMLAFAVSIVNGCETCVVSHENVLREAGVPHEKIHELVRIASVVKALKTLSEVAA